MQSAAVAERAADGRRRHRRELEGREALNRDVGATRSDHLPAVSLNCSHFSLNVPTQRSVSGGCAEDAGALGHDRVAAPGDRDRRAASAPRSAASGARTQPACAASHAACRSPWPRAAAAEPVRGGRAAGIAPRAPRSIRSRIALIDRAAVDLGARPGVAIERARPPVEHALARVDRQRDRASPAPMSKTRRGRAGRSSKYSVSPRPTMNSIRSRGRSAAGSRRRRRSRALVRSSAAALARKRSR